MSTPTSNIPSDPSISMPPPEPQPSDCDKTLELVDPNEKPVEPSIALPKEEDQDVVEPPINPPLEKKKKSPPSPASEKKKKKRMKAPRTPATNQLTSPSVLAKEAEDKSDSKLGSALKALRAIDRAMAMSHGAILLSLKNRRSALAKKIQCFFQEFYPKLSEPCIDG